MINVGNVAQLTTFRAESAKNVKDILWYADAHRHLPNRVAKHLRQTRSSFWNLVPEHRSNSITFSMEISLKTHIRRSTEQRRKEMEKVVGWMASYRAVLRAWSTKACAK